METWIYSKGDGKNLKLEDVEAELRALASTSMERVKTEEAQDVMLNVRSVKRNTFVKPKGMPSPPSAKDYSKVQCHKCQKFGHIKRICPLNLQHAKKESSRESANSSKEGEEILSFTAADKEESTRNVDEWVVDSDINTHVLR